MTPRAEACIRRARIDTACTAVGRSNTPAIVAATVFANAVSGEGIGPDPVRLHQLGQGVFDGEQGGLGAVRPLQVATGTLEHLGP